MATVSLAPNFKPQLFNAGVPLAGGKVYTYQSGTTTPQTTYTDSTGVTPNANPVILDANGEANIWLDVALSYKFVVKDSSDVVLKTIDGIIGTLTNNSVATATIQDSAVTNAKLASMASRTFKGNSTSASAAPTDVSLQSINSLLFIPASVQRFLSGSGTYYPSYAFILSGTPTVSPTAGATYTNNTVTFTVNLVQTVGTQTIVYAFGTGSPSSSGTLTKASGTGDSSIAFIEMNAAKWIKVTCVGGGGGGAGSGTSAGTASGAGGSSTFGTSLLTATGGGGGGYGGVGVAGSAPTVASPAISLIAVQGGEGGTSSQFATSTTVIGSGIGGNSILGGGGGGSYGAAAGRAGAANTGGGGSGGGVSTGGTTVATGGGGAGGSSIVALILGPSSSYSYAVGAGGTSGGNGASGVAGGAGGSGVIIVEEFYQ